MKVDGQVTGVRRTPDMKQFWVEVRLPLKISSSLGDLDDFLSISFRSLRESHLGDIIVVDLHEREEE